MTSFYAVYRCRVGADRATQAWCHSHHRHSQDAVAFAEAKRWADEMHRPDTEGVEAFVKNRGTVVYEAGGQA